jgi:acetyltransferase-like isoleucine patch superfamily enzyme
VKYKLFKIIQFIYKLAVYSDRRCRLLSAKLDGMIVGENTKFIGTQDFGTEPYLIEIGKDVLLTDGVRFITHDGSIQVPYIKQGDPIANVYGKKSTFGRCIIKNNVFIGVNAIILPNTIIGENSIIAAGAIVKGMFPANSVIGGNPAKVICSTDTYFEKNMSTVLNLTNIVSAKRKNRIISHLN